MKIKLPLLLSLLGLLVACSSSNTNGSNITKSADADSQESAKTSVESVNDSKEASTDEEGNKTYTFEAEYSEDIDDFEGMGYSGPTYGSNCILEDTDGSLNASNKEFVSYLYTYGTTLTWHVTASKKATNVIFSARLSAEYMSITINPNLYKFKINGKSITYQPIAFTFGSEYDGKSEKRLPFKDYVLNEYVTLNEGENEIVFLTDNSEPMEGTMAATAPIVDAFKFTVSSDVELSYTEYYW